MFIPTLPLECCSIHHAFFAAGSMLGGMFGQLNDMMAESSRQAAGAKEQALAMIQDDEQVCNAAIQPDRSKAYQKVNDPCVTRRTLHACKLFLGYAWHWPIAVLPSDPLLFV